MKWSEVIQSCPTLCDPVDCSLPGSSVHGILQARILEWVTISFSRGSSQPRDRTQVSCIGGRRFNLWATREALWWGRGMVSCCTLLGIRSFILESGHGQVNNVLVSLHQSIVLWSDKKGQGPQAWASHSEVQVWLRGGRSQLRAPSWPGPQTLPSHHHWGIQVPNPTGPQALQATHMAGTRSHWLCPMQTATAIRLPRWGWGRGSPQPHSLGPASGHSWQELWSPTAHSPELVPVSAPTVQLLAQGQVSHRVPGRRPGSTSYLTLHLTTTTPLLLAESAQ